MSNLLLCSISCSTGPVHQLNSSKLLVLTKHLLCLCWWVWHEPSGESSCPSEERREILAPTSYTNSGDEEASRLLIQSDPSFRTILDLTSFYSLKLIEVNKVKLNQFYKNPPNSFLVMEPSAPRASNAGVKLEVAGGHNLGDWRRPWWNPRGQSSRPFTFA